ncbi:hypothetical protein JDS78_19770 [Bacillus cereus group sp. N17]|uniref:hypothetical protein n=1 Tax=Bacillus cereus group TaxID=86661 RepID=UPI0018F6023A|nr:hypothetical protein [Bacillus cereus group sp. N17]MBJ8042477.1 hypothetical protein [Bacillus cereus group sp. N17]
MMTDPIASEKDKLIRDMYKKQKEAASLLFQHENHLEVSNLILECHSHKNYFVQNAALTKKSLEELKEKHTQIEELLKQAKNL